MILHGLGKHIYKKNDKLQDFGRCCIAEGEEGEREREEKTGEGGRGKRKRQGGT